MLKQLGYIDKRSDPKPCDGEIKEVHKGRGSLVVADCDAAHQLEPIGHAYNAIAAFVMRPICFLPRPALR